MNFVKRNKGLTALVVAAGIGILAWLAFGYFGIQAAFIDNVVEEDGPVFDVVATDAGAAAPAEVPTTPPVQSADAEAGTVVGDDEPAAPTDGGPDPAAAAAIAAAEAEAEAADDTPADSEADAADATASDTAADVDTAVDATASDVDTATDTAADVDTAAEPTATAEPTPVPTATPIPEPTATPEPEVGVVRTIAAGGFSSLNGYTVNGEALVLNNGTEQRFLQLQNFASDNGPDLKVYLRAASGEFISLGDLRGNIGDQSYEIPVEVDLGVFTNVEIWCERFSAGFGVATLTPSA